MPTVIKHLPLSFVTEVHDHATPVADIDAWRERHVPRPQCPVWLDSLVNVLIGVLIGVLLTLGEMMWLSH